MPEEFETRPVTFSDLLGSDMRFRVPSHQREYSWTKQNVRRLWDDLINTIDENRPEHFMGSILVQENGENSYAIIDGQQRLVTVSILLSVLRILRLNYGDEEIGISMAERYLGRISSATRCREPKLRLSERDADAYREFIIEAQPISEISRASRSPTTNRSSRLLLGAYVQLWHLVNEELDKFKDPNSRLGEIERALTERFTAILIVVPSTSNPYIIFETLNERAKPLDVPDLVKNYLFAQADTRLSKAEHLWNETITSLGLLDPERFLRHYWVSKHGLTRTHNIYENIQNSVKGDVQAIKFVRVLRDKARIYAALANPESPLWVDQFKEARPHLADLRRFKTTQCYPVLLAMYERYPNRFNSTARLLAVFTLRYSIVSRGSTGPLEAAYARICRQIQEGQTRSACAVFQQLEELYPDDDAFMTSFAQFSLPKARSPVGRYLLAKIEDRRRRSQERITDPDILTLEHILPLNPSPEWNAKWDAALGEMEEYVWRLGNLTLLSEAPGRKAGNAPFTEKCREIYSSSELLITRELTDCPEWGQDEIIKRQSRMAEEAIQIWRVDY